MMLLCSQFAPNGKPRKKMEDTKGVFLQSRTLRTLKRADMPLMKLLEED